MRACPNNRLLMMRTRGIAGPFFQGVAPGVCAKGVGSAYSPGGPQSGVRPASGLVTSETTATLTMTGCVKVNGAAVSPYGLTMTVGGAAATFTAAVNGSEVAFSNISPAVQAGDEVLVSFAGTDLVQCDDDPLDSFTDFRITNPIQLIGYILLEVGGEEYILLEDGDPIEVEK